MIGWRKTEEAVPIEPYLPVRIFLNKGCNFHELLKSRRKSHTVLVWQNRRFLYTERNMDPVMSANYNIRPRQYRFI